MRKKRRVPEVLWRLFRHRARPLLQTILSLLPSPPSSSANCPCEGEGCLGCINGDVSAFLLRPDDPIDYRKLMTECYVVVSDKAPPISGFFSVLRLPQREVVVRTIEMVMFKQPAISNVISTAYDKYKRSSPIVDLLTSPSWGLLLSRVMDLVMVHLLMHTSIFLPLSQKIHQQVAGIPVSLLSNRLSNYSSSSANEHDMSTEGGWQKTRKKVDSADSITESDQPSGSFRTTHCHCHSRGLSGCKRSYLQSSNHEDKQCQPSLSDTTSLSISVPTHTLERNSHRELEKSNEFVAKIGKHPRPYKWQRERKRRRLDSEGSCNLIPYTSSCSNKNIVHGKPPGPLCRLSKCSNFSMFQAPKNISEGNFVNRKSMFYNLDCSSSVLPRGNVLLSLKPNISDSEILARHIFGSSDADGYTLSRLFFCSTGTCGVGSKCPYHSLIKLFKVLIRRTRNCQHARLMDKHCGTPSLEQIPLVSSISMIEGSELDLKIPEVAESQSKKSPEAIDPQFAAKLFCSKSQVVSFIWAVCRSIVPVDMLGTHSNWRILRRNIAKFIQLRRFENFSLKQATHKLKTSSFPFLSHKLTLCCLDEEGCSMSKEASCMMKSNLMESWIYWLFAYFIVPLVQANFYVTETQFGKQEVYFFRKSIWEKVTKSATNFKDKGYDRLNHSTVRDILVNRSFGFSKLRFCPKENGVRILANLQACSRLPTEKFYFKGGQSSGVNARKESIKFNHYKPVNYVLRDMHTVLKGLKSKQPELLGASVSDYNDVYRKLHTFLHDLKKALTTMPDLFLVVSDVSNAFDSIDQDKLLDVMENVIVDEEYHLKHSHQVLSTKKTLWVRENVTLNKTTRPRFSPPQYSLHGVLVDQELSRSIKRKALLTILYEHVKRNVIQFDKNFYLQVKGIPQGSILSSLLSSFYFGDLERKVIFPFLERTTMNDLPKRLDFHDTSKPHINGKDINISHPGYMLLRFIDDFLFISTSQQQAAYFLSQIQSGFQSYKCYMNGRKFGLNFSVENTSGLVSSRVYVGEDGVSFLRWSGLLINCQSLEIQADYARYLNSHLRSTLTVSWQGKPGHRLKAKLSDYLRPKCHPIFYDLNINSAAVVRLNVFQAFMLCAMKFHSYICCLTYICRLSRKFCLNIILRSLRYMNALIRKKMCSFKFDSIPNPNLDLEDGEVEWLGLNAYIQVLTRKQARHASLLSSLKTELSAHRFAGRVSSDLLYAVDRSHSSLLWKIKY